MKHDFTGKVVAITGGAGFGMGNKMARDFFDAGAMVSICSRKKDRVEEAVREIGKADPSRCVGFVADMKVVADTQSFIDKTVDAFGRIDVLINNAGVYRQIYAVDNTEDDWEFQMGTKPKGYFFCATAAARHMIRQGEGGCIINIGSVNAECQSLTQVIYATANAGVRHMTECLAREWAGNQIRVNCIQPGSIPTEINYKVYHDKPELEDKMKELIPLGRRGDVADVSNLAMFLASEEDAGYITGAVVNVDGGFLLHSI